MTSYQLIFEGRIQTGRDLDEVKQNLASLFDVPASEIDTLFSGAPLVLKDDLDVDTAREDKAAFEKTGAVCRMEARTPAAERRWIGSGTPQATSERTEQPPGADRAAPAGHPATRRYGLPHPYFLSFFFKPFYQDVARHWRGLAFVHLFILLALTGVAFILHFQAIATAFVQNQAPAIIAQLPTIVIEKGKGSVAVEQPYQVFMPESRNLLAVIDTTGQITSLRQTDAILLLTRSRLIARLGAGDSRVIDLSPIEQMRLTRDDFYQWLQTTLQWAPFVLYPLTIFFTYCLRTVQVLIYGGIGLVVASLLKRTIPFGAAVSVAVMAMTPVILIDTLIMLLKIQLPLWGIGSFVLAFAYLFFGIRAATETA
ncbi:MAG: DUF1189 family protein [Desulfosarcina sp.]|nr:DUF1189 family protein [Desulfobacterales bacterium]